MGRRGIDWARACVVMLLLGAAGADEVRGSPPPQADKIVVVKHQRRLVLEKDGVVLREYRVALGHNPVGHKIAEGDGRTPEGVYRVDHRNPDSRFHRSMRISSPSDADMQASYARHFEPGGEVRIHGLPAAKRWLGHKHRQTDWTEGCIAVSSEEMDEIWQAVALGTTVEILP